MKSTLLLLSAAFCLLFAPSTSWSQVTQLGEIFRLDLPGGESQLPDVATGGGGGFVVVWRESPGGAVAGVSARRVEIAADGSAQPVGSEIVVEAPQPETDITRPGVAMDAAGRFVVVWGEGRIFESCVEGHRFDPLGVSLGRIVVDACSPVPRQPQTSVAITPDGRFAIAWDERTGTGPDEQAVFLRLFSALARPRGGPIRVADGVSGGGVPANPSVTLDFLGRPAVVWESGFQPHLRLFQATGQPRSGEIPFRFFATGPQVAAAATGKLVTAVANQSITVQLYTAAGQPYERSYSTDIQEPAADRVGNAKLAADSLGNFVLVWEEDWVDGVEPPELERPQIFVQVFNNRGALQSHAFLFSPGPGGAYTSPAVALREDGVFLVTWESRPPGGPSRILGQLFALREKDNVCVYRNQEFHCATLHSPSFFNQPVAFGMAGDRPFLADVDGDGDDDPCVRRGGAFLCDTAQDGGNPEVTLPFGNAGHVPLLGDLDGDGDDDPCVRRGRTFLCDTAHDSGEAEVRILFGLFADVPVLGDVDGDGDDDPCVFRPGNTVFLCDTDHDGKRDLAHDVDAAADDRPLLGDVDGDRRDDFCIVRGTSLYCDTGRTGILGGVAAGRGRDYLLLGNIDGF